MILSSKKAVIFDVDGVLVDSEPLSCGALRQVLLTECNVDTGSDFSAVLGGSNRAAVIHYLTGAGKTFESSDVDRIVKLKAEKYKQLAAGLEGFVDCEAFIQRLVKEGLRISVASSGSLEKIRFSLSKVGLLRYFDQLSSSEEVEHGKPAPDLFQLALKRAGVDSKEAVVIEDSVKGVRAARAAGIDVLGFVSEGEGRIGFSTQQLQAEGAEVFHSYKELIDKFR